MHSAASASLPELLHLVNAADRPHDLIAVGTAVHYFTHPLLAVGAPDPIQLHRATTVLTKQVARLLGQERPLALIAALVTDPNRPALPDGTCAAVVCGGSWEIIRRVASERVDAAVEGAATFGEAAVLRLAATRAADGRATWWGTVAWADAVERAAVGRRTAMQLLREPETADDADLAVVLGIDRRLATLAVHERALA